MSVLAFTNYILSEPNWIPPIEWVLKSWDNLLEHLFTIYIPLQYWINSLLKLLGDAFEWFPSFKLYPHWKHIFVLVGLVAGSLSVSNLFEGKYFFGIWALVISTLFSLVGATIGGLISLESSGLAGNFAIAFVPVLLFGFTVFIVWLPVGHQLFGKLSFFFRRSTISLFIILFLILIIEIGKRFFLPSQTQTGLLSLAVFIIYMGCERIHYGITEAKKNKTSIRNNPFTLRGVRILSGFIGMLFVLVIQVGGSILGTIPA
ncbi:MAG: hypothetical protein COA47_04255 [Robiginitomaculum sp.]|nr:MAG: hypothetical protein COA47_04255 [Robiginitomaculum sp.]